MELQDLTTTPSVRRSKSIDVDVGQDGLIFDPSSVTADVEDAIGTIHVNLSRRGGTI